MRYDTPRRAAAQGQTIVVWIVGFREGAEAENDTRLEDCASLIVDEPELHDYQG